MSRLRIGTPASIVLEHITWKTYERLLREMGERPIRLTYDDGDLEIMAMSFGHEHTKKFIGRMIEMLTFDLEIAVRSGGSTTLRKRLKKKGLEPDESYWIANAAAMFGKEEFDPELDPPPDLAVEVDISSSCIDRMRIYAVLGIGEVWRYYRRHLRVHLLTAAGQYEESDQSRVFPFLPVKDLDRFIHQSEKEDEGSVLRGFVKWLRSDVMPRYERYMTRTASARGDGKKNGKNGSAKTGK